MSRFIAAILFAAALTAQAAPTSSSAPASTPAPAARQTLEVAVDGLNCALCSEAMKTSLKKVAGATDLEPRLECGRIYLEVDPSATLNEAGLSFALMSNGFNFKGVRPVPQSLKQVRAHKDC